MKSAILTSLMLGIASIGLAGCNQQKQEQDLASEAAPEAPGGISVTDGVLMLPAVSGNPGAVYFDISNGGDRELAIASVSVAGAANAMIHSMAGGSMTDVAEVAIRPGATVAFEPGGLHVMAMDLDDNLAPGQTTEVTLTFADGDKVSFPAEIRAAGDR